jgi:hypothetical protein
MCVFGDAAGQNPLAEPLVRFIRESLDGPGSVGPGLATAA